MNIVLPSIMSKWPQRIVFTDRLSISAQIAVQFIPEDDEKNKSSQFIFSPEILQSWIMIWFVTVSARDLNFALFTFFPCVDPEEGRHPLHHRLVNPGQGGWVQHLQQAVPPLLAGKVAYSASKHGLHSAWIYSTAVGIPQPGKYTGNLQKLKVKEHLAKTGARCGVQQLS